MISTDQPSEELVIRNFQQSDMEALGELFGSVTTRKDVIFWWVGDEENWLNVFCAFEDGKMVAKGQVSIINIVPPGCSLESKHSIYLNLKTLPERENDYELLDKLYQHLYFQALALKETLPSEYKTILCVGNDSTEASNNDYFTNQKGFHHLNSLFKMQRNLSDPIPELSLNKEFDLMHWKMETSLEENEYIALDAEVWPETPMGFERLAEYKQNPLWTSMIVREAQMTVGGLMAWQEEDCGCIEAVFVREQWRGRGIAKYMLVQALQYLKAHELKSAYLMVLTSNNAALPLYESVGFFIEKEEVRNYIELE